MGEMWAVFVSLVRKLTGVSGARAALGGLGLVRASRERYSISNFLFPHIFFKIKY